MRFLIASLVCVAGIVPLKLAVDASDEMKEEVSLGGIGAVTPEFAPVYISHSLMGPFRAFLIDYMWLKFDRDMQRKAYNSAYEDALLIQALNPHNEEVNAYISWDIAYNVSARLTDENEAWKWEKKGCLIYARGIKLNPDSAHLWYRMGFDIYYRACGTGRFNDRFVSNYETDPETAGNEILGKDYAEPKCLAASISFYEKALEIMRKKNVDYVKSQMGLFLNPYNLELAICDMDFMAAIYFLRKTGVLNERAIFHLDRAMQRLERVKVAYRDLLPEHTISYRERLWTSILDAAPILRTGADIQNLATLEKVMRDNLWGPQENVSDLSLLGYAIGELKQRVTGDKEEFNDLFSYANQLTSGREVSAELKPAGDVDKFSFVVPAPMPGEQFHPRFVFMTTANVDGKPKNLELYVDEGNAVKRIGDPRPIGVSFASPLEYPGLFYLVVTGEGSYTINLKFLAEVIPPGFKKQVVAMRKDSQAFAMNIPEQRKGRFVITKMDVTPITVTKMWKEEEPPLIFPGKGKFEVPVTEDLQVPVIAVRKAERGAGEIIIETVIE